MVSKPSKMATVEQPQCFSPKCSPKVQSASSALLQRLGHGIPRQVCATFGQAVSADEKTSPWSWSWTAMACLDMSAIQTLSMTMIVEPGYLHVLLPFFSPIQLHSRSPLSAVKCHNFRPCRALIRSLEAVVRGHFFIPLFKEQTRAKGEVFQYYVRKKLYINYCFWILPKFRGKHPKLVWKLYILHQAYEGPVILSAATQPRFRLHSDFHHGGRWGDAPTDWGHQGPRDTNGLQDYWMVNHRGLYDVIGRFCKQQQDHQVAYELLWINSSPKTKNLGPLMSLNCDTRWHGLASTEWSNKKVTFFFWATACFWQEKMQRNRCSSDTSTRSAVLFGSGGSGGGKHWFLMMLPWIELFLPMFGWQDRKHHVTFLNARLGLGNQSVSCRLIPIVFSCTAKEI